MTPLRASGLPSLRTRRAGHLGRDGGHRRRQRDSIFRYAKRRSGFVHTPLTEPATAIAGVLDECLENTSLGRPGEPEYVAAAVAFLCSPQASRLTGEVLDLNGGAHLKRYANTHERLPKPMNRGRSPKICALNPNSDISQVF